MTQMKQIMGFVADTADLDLGLAESPPWRWRERPEKLDRWATRFRASQQTFPLDCLNFTSKLPGSALQQKGKR